MANSSATLNNPFTGHEDIKTFREQADSGKSKLNSFAEDVSSKIETFSEIAEINSGIFGKLLHVCVYFSLTKVNMSFFCCATNLSITGSFIILLQQL